ncbi:MAG: DUF262 domain-containing protein [Flavobacterium sp.]|nr:DUF262 domain-containing protein [Flavobacterium sp.]
MKTENHSIHDVLAKNATSFFIPPFQRAYAWGKPEIERYFSDVTRIINSEVDSTQHEKLEHFFGTLVIKEEKSGFAHKSVVVDGQQRLTSTLIFLIALRDLENDVENKNRITRNYLTNDDSTFQDKIKLKQVTKDWQAYRALVLEEEVKPGIIKNAYQLFLKLIIDKKALNASIELKHYILAIQKMNVAIIFLDERPFKGEDPQIIFETLNSLGKPLTLSDLVRNYVLLNLNSIKQSDIYEKIWHPKIETVLIDKTSEFFRDYLQFKTESSIKVVSDNNTKEVYQLFKEFVETTFGERIDFINDITEYVIIYKWIIIDKITDVISENFKNNAELKELLRNIFHDIKAEAFKPFVLGLLKYHQDKSKTTKLTDEVLINVLKIIRTYLIRKRILGLTQGENKNIVLLCNRIEDLAAENTTMVELLSNMFFRMRFPNDGEMKDKLSTLNFYEGLKKYSKFILGKIEENNTKVAVDFRNPKITIEHIMPQKLDETWKSELGKSFDNVHKTFIHNIGNLILTEFNSEIGNKPFTEKKSKLKTSNLNYRLAVIDKNIWNQTSIMSHQSKMIEWFLETFPLPETYKTKSNWNTKVNDNSLFSPIDNDASDFVEGNKPEELIIYGTILKVKSWQDVFISFVKYLRDYKHFDFEFILENQFELFKKEETIVEWKKLELLVDKNPDLSNRYKAFDGRVWEKFKELKQEEIFIHINISATGCISRLSNIMNKLNMDELSVQIKLK